MSRRIKIVITLIFSIIILALGIGIGTVYISPSKILGILSDKILSTNFSKDVDPILVSILWKIRLPRTLLAFFVGAALSVSGTVMQSVLRNPLASSFTLGVSSGAAFGAGLVILFGISIPFFGIFTLPLIGLIFGLATVFLAIGFASKVDRNLENHTIILVGMVLSLFVNAVLTTMSALSKTQMQRLVLWQMGSFAMKEWAYVLILIPIVVIGVIVLIRYTNELDIMTFGEEQAKTIGVDVKRIKWLLLSTSAILTGVAVAFAGIIGFIDLIVPHIVRKIFGSSHKFVIPLSAVFGGAFMIVVDLISRTIVSPSELPIGAVTALIGAPFFTYIYFGGRKKVS
ncbi:MAG: ABC-type Fe3+-siderophore transport system, permease component [Clostridiales bacterium]|jgi:iron complex transport system permease protein|nr:ABC-type Fe3+-siderophore transport system, permease component [Clostridiales bacterium]